MKFRAVRLPATLACMGALLAAPASFAADKEILELQRDVALIGEQLTNLQSMVNQRLSALSTLAQQTLDRANQNHTDNAVVASHVSDQLRQQQQDIATSLATLGAKLDQVATDVSANQQNLADVTSRLGRLEQRMVDLENAVKASQSPAAPPPDSQSPGGSPGGSAGGPPAGTTAEGLFQGATRDQLSGNSDLALQEYRDYVKYFGKTETAATAQYHIGELLLAQGKLDDAIQAVQTVIDQYPKSDRVPDALYLKAQALEKQGNHIAAVQALNQLVRQYPYSDAADNAKAQLARAKPPQM